MYRLLLLWCLCCQAAAQESLVVGWGDWQPFSYRNEQHQLQGLDIELLNAIASKHGWEVDISWANTGTRFGQGLAFMKTIDRGICDRALLSGDLKRNGARVRGAVDNLLVGSTAGAKMDVIDQNCVGRVLEYALDSRRIYWRNSDNGFTYAVVPTRTYQDATGAYCREYHTSASSGPLLQQMHGLACRRSDGSWRATH